MKHSLWDMLPGQRCRLLGFDERLDPRYQRRLIELGFGPGELVSCLISPAFGAPKVYCVSNSVFSLEDSIARFVQAEHTSSHS